MSRLHLNVTSRTVCLNNACNMNRLHASIIARYCLRGCKINVRYIYWHIVPSTTRWVVNGVCILTRHCSVDGIETDKSPAGVGEQERNHNTVSNTPAMKNKVDILIWFADVSICNSKLRFCKEPHPIDRMQSNLQCLPFSKVLLLKLHRMTSL